MQQEIMKKVPELTPYDVQKYIDATDPEGVWIEGVYGTGLDIDMYGHMGVTSFAWYKADEQGATKEEVKEVGYCGVYVDGVITFPVKGLVAVNGAGKAYFANINGEFALDMSNMLQTLPEDGGKEAAPAARVGVDFKGEAMGKVARFKKIDNSFIAPMGY
jgi:hypothetical protein